MKPSDVVVATDDNALMNSRHCKKRLNNLSHFIYQLSVAIKSFIDKNKIQRRNITEDISYDPLFIEVNLCNEI